MDNFTFVSCQLSAVWMVCVKVEPPMCLLFALILPPNLHLFTAPLPIGSQSSAQVDASICSITITCTELLCRATTSRRGQASITGLFLHECVSAEAT